MIKHINSIGGALMVWIISYIFFLLTLANNFSASHDSINYLIGIVNGQHLFHQHHLLYHFFAHEWLMLFKQVFPSLAVHYIIESFTALWGSSTLAVCYLFFRNRFSLPAGISAIGVSIIAFSYGMWFYSVNIEVYTPPLFFILLSLYVISRKEARESDAWKIAVLHSLAILFHQVNMLFGIVVLYWIFINRKHLNAGRLILQYTIVGFILTGTAYFLIGWMVEGHNTVPEFINWVLGYTIGHSYWQPISWKTPVQVLTGFSRAFFGGHFIFQLPAMEHFLRDSFRTHGLRDELYLSEKITVAFTWLLTILTFITVVALGALVIRFTQHYRQMKLHFRLLKPLLLCLLVYSVFFCFWMPEILEFWILQMVLLWLMIIGMLPVFRFPLRIPARTGLIVLSLFLFTINYTGSMRWLGDIRNDWYYMEVKKLDPSLGEQDVVIVENEWILKDYVRYYSRARLIATDEPGFSREATHKLVSDAISKNGRVYLYRAGNNNSDAEWQLIRSY